MLNGQPGGATLFGPPEEEMQLWPAARAGALFYLKDGGG